jgi:hypothetical protein
MSRGPSNRFANRSAAQDDKRWLGAVDASGEWQRR